MIEKFASILVGLAIAAGALWLSWGKVVKIAQAPLLEKHKEDIAMQAKANSQAAATVQIKKIKGETVYIDRIKEIKVYAENLPKDAACLADAEFVRLHRTAVR